MAAAGYAPLENYREEPPDILGYVKRTANALCQRTFFSNLLPILKWLPEYKLNYLFEDMVAGITVGLTAIPQGIAYAEVAGLKPQYGLYSAFMGCFVYILVGSCKDVTVGPTAIMSLMVHKYVTDSPDFAILSCFLAGCIILIFGLLNFGFLIQFISTPVTVGFTSAAAITIATGQIDSFFGIKSKSNDFFESWKDTFVYFPKLNIWDTVLGTTTIISLLILRQCNRCTGRWQLFGKYISLSRNAIGVIVGSTIAYGFSIYDLQPFTLTGKVASGFPPFKPPPFSTISNNGTEIDFNEMINILGSSVIAIPLIAILESIAVAKAFSKGKTINASQEMIALGLCNLTSSFVSSMPITGSFTRTAVNHSSGVRTTLGGLFTGCLVILALGFLSETFYYIPKATLAAIIISAMIFMIEYKKMIEVWKAKKIDIIPLAITLIICIWYGLEYGILAGIGTNITIILFSTSRPKINTNICKIKDTEVLLVTPDQSLVYSSAEFIEHTIFQNLNIDTDNKITFIIINGEYINSIDSTVALNILTTYDDLREKNCQLLFWNWKRKAKNVICRLNVEVAQYFRSGEILDEIVEFQNPDNIDDTNVINI